MIVGFHQLYIAIVVSEELFDGCAGLIICDVKCWFETLVGECDVDLFEGIENGSICGGGDGDRKYVVCIVVVSDKKILMAINGAGR